MVMMRNKQSDPSSATYLEKMILENEFDVNRIYLDGNTPLHYSVKEQRANDVKMLVKHGANVNQANKNGYTPLYLASMYTDDDIVRTLLENGAKVNATDYDGTTCLHHAVMNGRFQMMYDLIRYGASPIAMDANGDTPMSLLEHILENFTEEDYENQDSMLIDLMQVKSMFMMVCGK